MGGSVGKSESGSRNQTQFGQDVWQPQGEALQNMYGQVGDLFGQSTGAGKGGKGGLTAQDQMQGGQQFSADAMRSMQDPWQQQMRGGAYGDMNLQNELMGSLGRSLDAPSAMQDINAMIMGGSGNTYADAMRNQYMQDATGAQENMLRNMDARAAASGMSGGARHGMAIGQGMEDINRNLQRNMAQTGFETFDKDLERKLQIAQQADQGTLARQNMMQQMLGGQQQAMAGGLGYGGDMMGYGSQQQMMPWQQAGAYSNILGGPQVLSSGTGEGGSSGKGLGLSGGK